MPMLGACVNLKLLDKFTPQAVLWQHAPYGKAYHPIGLFLNKLAGCGSLKAAHIAAVSVIGLLIPLIARQLDLVCIYDNDEIAGIDVRRVSWEVLAANPYRHLARQPAEHLVFGIDYDPLALIRLKLCALSFH